MEVLANGNITETLTDSDIHTIEHILAVLRPFFIVKTCKVSVASQVFDEVMFYFSQMDAVAIDMLLEAFCKNPSCSAIPPVRDLVLSVRQFVQEHVRVPEEILNIKRTFNPNCRHGQNPLETEGMLMEYLRKLPKPSMSTELHQEMQSFSHVADVDYTDPLKWWRSVKAVYPHLSRLAQMALTFPSNLEIVPFELPNLPPESLEIPLCEIMFLRLNFSNCPFVDDDFLVVSNKNCFFLQRLFTALLLQLQRYFMSAVILPKLILLSCCNVRFAIVFF